MIDKSKTYKTRDGREVRIYATDGCYQTVYGAILEKDGWRSVNWYKDGLWSKSQTDHDLIEVRPRIKRTVWLNIYKHGLTVAGWATKQQADGSPAPRIACIKVDLDFEEGEGL